LVGPAGAALRPPLRIFGQEVAMSRIVLMVSTLFVVVCAVACGGFGSTGTKRGGESTSEAKAPAGGKETKPPQQTGKRPATPENSSPNEPITEKTPEPDTTARQRWVAAGCPSLNLASLKSGDLGVLPVGEIRNESVGPKEAPDQPGLWRIGFIETRPTVWKVLQVMDSQSALMIHSAGYYEKQINGETFWFEMNTEGMVDGRKLSFDGIWECKGTKRYTPVLGGSMTVFVLRYCGATEAKKSATPDDPMAAAARWLAFWTDGWTKQQFMNEERTMMISLFAHLVKVSNSNLERVDEKITAWANHLKAFPTE
jgi:hypothetical protein